MMTHLAPQVCPSRYGADRKARICGLHQHCEGRITGQFEATRCQVNGPTPIAGKAQEQQVVKDPKPQDMVRYQTFGDVASPGRAPLS